VSDERGDPPLEDYASDTLFSLLVGDDGALRYDAWNRRCEEVTGLRREVVRGRTPVEMFGVETGAAFERHYRDCVEAGVPIAYDEDVVFLGQLETATTRLFPVRGEDGRVRRVVGAASNMGPQRRSEAALRHSEEKYRHLLETLQEGVWAVDTQGLTTFVNPAMARMLGYAVDEMLGKHLDDFMDAEGAATTARNMARRAAGISEQHDFVFLRKDGSRVTALLETSPLRDERGVYLGALAGVLDISPLRKAEAERGTLERRLLEAQRLESLGLLSGGIAHDFNNLLTAILLNATSEELTPGLPSSVRAALRGIEEAARAGAELCQQLLAYSGRGRFDVRAVDLGEFVRETTELVRVSVPRGIGIQFALAPMLPTTEADLAQLRQVVLNLVLNAAEAMTGHGGTLTLGTRLATLPDADHEDGLTRPLSAGDYVVLDVVDDGQGMSADTLARIWDPFYTTKFTGRGLGLSAVLGIVHGHGGALRVVSEPGRGTTFTVYLPASAAPAAGRTPSPEVASAPRSAVVLLVDDEPLIRAVAGQLLESLGFEALVAKDGQEAVAVFAQHRTEIQCVLLDLTMPVLDGEGAFRAIRALRHDVPVVLMSGYSEHEATARFVGEGLAGFLQKPFGVSALEACVRTAIAQKNPPQAVISSAR
jgi:two-component system cell cycle sensor histidine kinase/response regulator CckA